MQRDRYHATQNKFPGVKKVITKQPAAGRNLLANQNLNSNIVPLAAPSPPPFLSPCSTSQCPTRVNTRQMTAAKYEALGKWQDALSIQLDAANKAFLSATTLKTLLPVAIQDIETHRAVYLTRCADNGLISEYILQI